MKVELVAKTVPQIDEVNTDNFAAYIARIGKVKDNPEKLMKYLIKHKHWSPFEHTYFSFKIRTSRAIGRELLRHRSMTFQELSQRYEEVMEAEPIELRRQAEKNRQSSEDVFDPVLKYNMVHELGKEPYRVQFPASEAIEDLLNDIFSLYDKLLEAGVARECARMILPEATSTTILMTGNLRSWIHFLALRNDPAAQKEAQEIAKAIQDILMKEVPTIFAIQDDK